jgi:hypothetical protein
MALIINLNLWKSQHPSPVAAVGLQRQNERFKIQKHYAQKKPITSLFDPFSPLNCRPHWAYTDGWPSAADCGRSCAMPSPPCGQLRIDPNRSGYLHRSPRLRRKRCRKIGHGKAPRVGSWQQRPQNRSLRTPSRGLFPANPICAAYRSDDPRCKIVSHSVLFIRFKFCCSTRANLVPVLHNLMAWQIAKPFFSFKIECSRRYTQWSSPIPLPRSFTHSITHRCHPAARAKS